MLDCVQNRLVSDTILAKRHHSFIKEGSVLWYVNDLEKSQNLIVIDTAWTLTFNS